MSPLEPKSPTTEGPKDCIAKAQDNALKIAFVNVSQVLEEEINKYLLEIYEKPGNSGSHL